MIMKLKCSLSTCKIKEHLYNSFVRNGCALPTLFLFSKDKPIQIENDLEDPLIYRIGYDTKPDEFGVYKSYISFNFKKSEHEKDIYKLMHKIVSMYSPDLILFAQQISFNNVSYEDYKKGVSVLDDPMRMEAIQLVTYSSDEEIGFSSRILFEEDANEEAIFGGDENYKVFFMDYPWYPAVGTNEVAFKNPYFN